jgi:hypothetical protein
MAKLGANDPCWCNSGKKYKRCHRDREREKALPLGAVAAQARPFYEVKRCLHPLASPANCGRIIDAHTVQRRGPLSQIIDRSGQCLTFFDPKAFETSKPVRRGWKEASTFKGFCERHDGPTFAPVERVKFVGTSEQCFLLAYRAECHELYQKEATKNSHEPIRHLLDRGRPAGIQRAIQEMQRHAGEGVTYGLAEARRHKSRMDEELLQHDFGGLQHLFVRFGGPLAVVSTGAPCPNNSLPKWRSQNFHNDAPIERVYVNVVTTEVGGAVVLSYRSEAHDMRVFIEELQRVDSSHLPAILVQLMFAYLENTYFSAEWWDTLNPAEKEHVAILAVRTEPYYTPWEYWRGLHVPWSGATATEVWES